MHVPGVDFFIILASQHSSLLWYSSLHYSLILMATVFCILWPTPPHPSVWCGRNISTPVLVSKSWRLGWVLCPMKSGAFIREKRKELRERDTEEGKPWEDRDGVYSYADTAKECFGGPNLEEARKDSFLEPSEGNDWFQTSGSIEYKFLLF